MIANIGFLDNIAYNYHRGRITPSNEIVQMTDGLNWEEEAQLIKWYNKTVSEGVNSTAHFKLVCVVCEIIKKHKDASIRKSIMPPLTLDANKWINYKC